MNRHERRRAAALGSRVQGEAAPPEDMGLYWSVMRRAMAEDESGRRGPYCQVHRAIMGARRLVLTKRVTALAEDLRISDLGVTIHSFEMGVPHPGTTWMEWDAAVEGRNPALPHQVPYERVGVLIEADDTGHRGQIAVLAKTAPTEGRRADATMAPVVMTFDLREDFERPASIMAPASADQIRRALAATQDPTTAELELSVVSAAAMERRFGVVENPYLAATLQESLEVGEGRWHEVYPDLLHTAADEIEMTYDATLALCAFIVTRTVAVETIEVRPGARRRVPTFGIDRTPLGYRIIDLPATGRAPDGRAIAFAFCRTGQGGV